MNSDKMNVAYRKDCALAEKEALQFLHSVHMPVINIPSMRGISLTSYRRQMNKCDMKVTEMDIVLVAVTDFVAAALACPPLFGWNVLDNSEQVSAVLADLGRRWTRLLTTDQSRRVVLWALLESSLSCLGDRHARYFQEALRAGQRLVTVEADVVTEVGSVPVVDLVSEAVAVPKTAASLKLDVFGQIAPGSNDFALCTVRAMPAPLPPKKLLTLHAFFPKRDAGAIASLVGAGNERREPTPPVEIGNDRPQVFAASQGQLIVYPTNPADFPLGRASPGHDACPTHTSAQSLMPLVNTTNLGKPKTSSGDGKPATDSLHAMMVAAKENKRKPAGAFRMGQNKLARKGC